MTIKQDPSLDSHPALTDSVQFRFAPFSREGAICQVRIFWPASKQSPVVVITELPENKGMSVTNAIAQIIPELEKAFELPAGTVFVEHYPDRRPVGSKDGTLEESFDEVQLMDGEDGQVRPQWRRLDKEKFFRVLGTAPSEESAPDRPYFDASEWEDE